jgi:methylmalonyl-CoA epimerase
MRAHVRALARHTAQLVGLMDGAEAGSALLTRFGDRLASLVAELAWEVGIGAEARAPELRPKLDHVGIVVNDLGAAAALFTDLLNGTVVAGGSEATHQVRSLHLTDAGGAKVELLEPTGGGAMSRFLSRHGEGVHHLTFLVDDLVATVDRLEAAGHRVVDMDIGSDTWREAYVSPRSAHGCLVQLVETREGYGDPVAGITVDDVLAGRWEWVDHRPRRCDVD